MHDNLHTMEEARYSDRRAAFETVDHLLKAFQGQYRFVNLTRLLDSGPPIKQLWNRAPDANWVGGLVSATE
jgi:hypothetical protein